MIWLLLSLSHIKENTHSSLHLSTATICFYFQQPSQSGNLSPDWGTCHCQVCRVNEKHCEVTSGCVCTCIRRCCIIYSVRVKMASRGGRAYSQRCCKDTELVQTPASPVCRLELLLDILNGKLLCFARTTAPHWSCCVLHKNHPGCVVIEQPRTKCCWGVTETCTGSSQKPTSWSILFCFFHKRCVWWSLCLCRLCVRVRAKWCDVELYTPGI